MNPKFPRFDPAVLPPQYLSRAADGDEKSSAKRFLNAGRIFASAQPMTVTTILGSGVSVCIYDPVAKVGGLNHYLFPDAPCDDSSILKFAQAANDALLKEVLGLGANRNQLHAKLFGGMQPPTKFGVLDATLGDRNVAAGLEFLHSHGITLKDKVIGGTRGRRLLFQTASGEASCDEL